MRYFRIYDKNNENTWCGSVIAVNEIEAAQIVKEQHPHFSDDELEIVWRKNRGVWKSKNFGLKEDTTADNLKSKVALRKK